MIQKQAYVKRPRWILLQIPSCPTEHLGAEVLQAMHESYKNLMFLERETCQVFIHHDAWSFFFFFFKWLKCYNSPADTETWFQANGDKFSAGVHTSAHFSSDAN